MVKDKKESISIRVSKTVHKQLEEDRDHFQKSIGGTGKWSIDDVVEEYQRQRKKIHKDSKLVGRV